MSCREKASQQILWELLTSEGISCQEQATAALYPALVLLVFPYQQPVTEMLNLRAFGTSAAGSATILPYSPPLFEGTSPRPPHQVCDSRATLPAWQGKAKARPHKLQKPFILYWGTISSAPVLEAPQRAQLRKCPLAKPAVSGLPGSRLGAISAWSCCSYPPQTPQHPLTCHHITVPADFNTAIKSFLTNLVKTPSSRQTHLQVKIII